METLRIKKDVSVIGWLLLAGQIVMQGAAMLVMLFGMLFRLDGTLMIASDVGSFIANFVIMGIFWLAKRKELPPMETKRSENPLKLILFALAAMICLNGTVSLLDYITNENLSVPIIEMTDSDSPLINLLLIAVFPAIVEEFAFRKVIFGAMRQYGFGTAALFSSLMFGLMHQNFIQLIFAFGMGMLLCLLYEHTGKLVCCSLLHFVNNAYAVLLSTLPVSERVGILIEISLCIVGLIVTVWLFISKGLTIRKLLQIVGDNDKKTLSGNLRTAMTSVPVMIYTVMCLIMCVLVVIAL